MILVFLTNNMQPLPNACAGCEISLRNDATEGKKYCLTCNLRPELRIYKVIWKEGRRVHKLLDKWNENKVQ